MLVSEAISQVKNDLKLVHADKRVTNKFIYSLLTKHAAWLIKRESDQLRLIKSDNIWQTLHCIEIIDVPTTDPCCKFKSKCSILRTKDKLPETFEDSWGILVKHVASIDNSQDLHPIKMSEWTRKLDNPNFKYDKTKYYFYKDGYLYFPNITWKLVTITGYFKDDITKYNLCDETSQTLNCSILDTEWRVPLHLQSMIIDSVLKELTATYLQIPSQETKIDKQ
jgi:hypothetical protein